MIKKIILFTLYISGFVLILSLTNSIVNAQSFNPNLIIDDATFNNTSSMTSTQINDWLNSVFGSGSCISTDHGFSAPDPTGYNPTSGFTYGNDVSAGQVIYDAAQAYSVNPQVLLVTLEKEQSLVSGSNGCSTLQYAGATGYGCPDGGTTYNYSGVDLYSINGSEVTSVNGTCVGSNLEVGFSQQIIHAAWLLKFGEQRSEGNINWDVQLTNFPEAGDSWNNSDDPQSCYSGPMTQGTFQICPNQPSTFYDGYTTIDGTSLYMGSGATASLYYYTPHLNGNNNFWNIFNSWFGSSVTGDPVSTLNFVRLNYYSGNMQVVGYSSVGDYSYTNTNTTIPYPNNTSDIPIFRPNGDLSIINLDDSSGNVQVTTFSAASDYQQLSSVINVPYPAVPNNGAVIPLFRPNGDLSFVRLNYFTGNAQIVTYSFDSYFQLISSNIVTAYPAVPTNGTVIPMFQPNENLSFVNLNYYTGNSQIVTYDFHSYYQEIVSNIVTPYPSVGIGSPVTAMLQPNGDLSFVNENYYSGNSQIVTYGVADNYETITGNYLTGYPSVSDFINVKPVISTGF
ncbi:MAG: hypothetical protein ACYCPS_01635 [Candidatus Saccharimonadales bacterium]